MTPTPPLGLDARKVLDQLVAAHPDSVDEFVLRRSVSPAHAHMLRGLWALDVLKDRGLAVKVGAIRWAATEQGLAA